MNDRRPLFLRTFTGGKFWPHQPSSDCVSVHDIAHALSLVCRWGGQCREFYSVAQHSVFVANLLRQLHPEWTPHALVHDASEAYLGDVTTPVKRVLGDTYRELERRTQAACCVALRVDHWSPACHEYVKGADWHAMQVEADALIAGGASDMFCYDPFYTVPPNIVGNPNRGIWPPKDAERAWLALYQECEQQGLLR